VSYQEEEYLLLSGIQHFAFCRRQWALIHIEQQWRENILTIEGDILHEKAHDEKCNEKRKGLLLIRGMAVSSRELGLSGICDVVEFHQDESGVALHGRRGRFLPLPVEYKRGKPKKGPEDALQLCAQAMCLEEMLVCEIPIGYLYYGETKHRQEVLFTLELRALVSQMCEEMHHLFRRRYTPKVKTGGFCRSCSLKDICLPQLNQMRKVSDYLKSSLEEET